MVAAAAAFCGPGNDKQFVRRETKWITVCLSAGGTDRWTDRGKEAEGGRGGGAAER